MEALSNDIDSCTGIIGIEILATDLRGRCFVDAVAGFSLRVFMSRLPAFFFLHACSCLLTLLQCALVRDTSSSKHARAKQRDLKKKNCLPLFFDTASEDL